MQAGQVAQLFGVLDLRNNASAELNKAEKDFQGFGARVERVGASLQNFGGAMSTLTAPLMALGATGLRSFAQFDSTLTEISARTGVVGDELAAISEYAMQMGADTVFSSQDAANAMLDLLSSGQTLEQAMQTLPDVLNLAAAGSLDLGSAADYVTDIMAMYGLSVDDAASVTDALARAASSSSADVSQLSQAFQNVGPVASQFGLDVDETAAILAIFAENGIKGAEAGTQLRSMLLNMNRNTESVKTAWAELGTSLYDSAGNMRDLDTVLAEMRDGLAGLPIEKQNELLQALGGSYGIVGMQALLASDGIDAMTLVMSGQASAADVAGTMMGTLSNKFNSLMGSVQALQFVLLSANKGPMVAFLDNMILAVNAVTEWAQANPVLAQQIFLVVAALTALGPVAMMAGAAISALGTIITVLSGPIGWAIGAVTALVVAYQTNFMGFADFVNNTVAPAFKLFGFHVVMGAQWLAEFAVKFGEALAGMIQFFGMIDWGNAWEMFVSTPLKNAAANMLPAIWEAIASAPVDVWQWLTDNIGLPLAEAMMAFDWSVFTEPLAGFGSSVFGALADSLPSAADWVGATIINPIIEALQGLPDMMKSLINQAIPDSFTLALPSFSVNVLGNAVQIGGQSLSIGPIPDPFPGVSGRAMGGTVMGGGAYRVGERGPEMFESGTGRQYLIPGEGGRVVPNGGGGGVVVNLQTYGRDPYDLAEMIKRALEDMG